MTMFSVMRAPLGNRQLEETYDAFEGTRVDVEGIVNALRVVDGATHRYWLEESLPIEDRRLFWAPSPEGALSAANAE